ncbi:hypothetical protein NEOLEDRAFT_1084718 [Neolentinus lepideus HHB14362 ss-1]|uniref:Hypervirulence associated protein TUDOR domain-containing protein n=1 Tax=Neolentinus lepideus HHB14362 ss-1 TaxID=1314782 RepID=A0A165VLW7_9AGAM|nr:hypothetical protein NEOLEDRAFT_1084718 [Neolentinus lepideus HHB14362 ss-1]
MYSCCQQKGDKIEYRPVGGQSDTVSHSTGEIVDITDEGGETRYSIKNDTTGKTTSYQEMNIVKKI